MSGTKPSSGLKRLRAYLPSGLANTLSRHADVASKLRHLWQTHVPEPLASHAHPVRYEAGVLYVHVDTPAWASRLRQQQTSVATSLRRDAMARELVEIRVRVVPLEQAIPRTARTPARTSRLTTAAASQIDRTADGINDPELRAALKRLADRAARSPSSKRGR
ncbi:MAG: DUF721 domain-containing protein [Gammaproteobacteria bacterium]|nr:DUF721 domain-containing protein [Gammaproteobacteria bacterium]